jgi:hypothetical protein
VIGDASEHLILGDKAAIENPFFRMVPDWGLPRIIGVVLERRTGSVSARVFG